MPKKGTTKFMSNRQEKKVVKELKGRQQINSGAFWSLPGDIRTDKLLCECKTTKNSYYSLKADTWLKIRSEAINDGLRTPVMCIDLENGKTRVAVFEHEAFSHYKEYENYSAEYEINLLGERKSYRICGGTENHLLSFIGYDPIIKLEVILWDNFINIINGDLL